MHTDRPRRRASNARALVRVVVCALTVAVSRSAVATTFTGPGGPLVDATDDGGTFTPGVALFPIDVSGTGGVVTAVNSVTLTNLTHSWLGDNAVALIGPDGATLVTITSPPDDVGANFNGSYRLVVDPTLKTVDEAAIPLFNSQDLPSGSYAISDYGGGNSTPGPRTTYAPLTGQSMDGTWNLLIEDFAPGDTGALGSWSIDVSYVAAPEPGELCVLVPMLGALLSRRNRRLGPGSWHL